MYVFELSRAWGVDSTDPWHLQCAERAGFTRVLVASFQFKESFMTAASAAGPRSPLPHNFIFIVPGVSATNKIAI